MSLISKTLFKYAFKECGEYGLGLWQCPSFLFIVMGVINISSMLGVYVVVRSYDIPELVVLSVSGISIIIFTIGSSVIKGVEHIARANKMKSEFISIASHQLKAPLSGIRWSTDVLLGSKIKCLEPKQEEYLKDIQENTTRMIRLVNDLLDVSRIDAGKMSMNIEEVNLKDVVRSVIKDLDSFAKANNAEIQVNVDENTNNVRTDSIRIRMVIQNFIDNAVKYIGTKRGSIKISLKNKGTDVYCCVVDNGIGIPKKEQMKIFDKFFRGSGIVKKQTIGSGLGLYIAKAAIESSKGKIGFNSEESKGSTFWFSLPAVEKIAANEVPQKAA